jgi:hypothetical protein
VQRKGNNNNIITVNQMSSTHCSSYKNENINVFIIDGTTRLGMERLAPGVSRVYAMDADGRLLAPHGIRVQEISEGAVEPHNNEFLLQWAGNYVISIGDKDRLYITNQKQQSCTALLEGVIMEEIKRTA